MACSVATAIKAVRMREKKKADGFPSAFLHGAPGEIRTPDPQVRSLVLYPTELRAQKRNCAESVGIPSITMEHETGGE
jgi:hypothetical protein